MPWNIYQEFREDLPPVATEVPLDRGFKCGQTYSVVVNEEMTATFVDK